MKYRIIITKPAECDIDEAYTWLASRSRAQGIRWYYGLLSAVEKLSLHPLRCPVIREEHSHPFEVRHLIHGRKHGRYRIFFKVERSEVVILRVLHSAREGFAAEE